MILYSNFTFTDASLRTEVNFRANSADIDIFIPIEEIVDAIRGCEEVCEAEPSSKESVLGIEEKLISMKSLSKFIVNYVLKNMEPTLNP